LSPFKRVDYSLLHATAISLQNQRDKLTAIGINEEQLIILINVLEFAKLGYATSFETNPDLVAQACLILETSSFTSVPNAAETLKMLCPIAAKSEWARNVARFSGIFGIPESFISEGTEDILGLPIAVYQHAASAYQEELQKPGVAALLNRATDAGGTPDNDPVWFTFSPFGLHSREFMTLARDPQVRAYFESQQSLQVASYGAGLHNEMDYIRYRFSDTGLGAFDNSLEENLALFQRDVFGPTGKSSYEPRELLLLFLAGDRDGAIDVFDSQTELALELQRPTLPMIDLLHLYYSQKELRDRVAEYHQFLRQGREVEVGYTQIFPLGQINYLSFGLTNQEMAKIRYRQTDIALDPLEEKKRFHLSVWLESAYFFDEPLKWIVLSKIVRAMQSGSYLLTNPIKQGKGRMVSNQHLGSFAEIFGLEFMGLLSSHLGRGGSAALYRRVSDRETNIVKRLNGIARSSAPTPPTESYPANNRGSGTPSSRAPSGSTPQVIPASAGGSGASAAANKATDFEPMGDGVAVKSGSSDTRAARIAAARSVLSAYHLYSQSPAAQNRIINAVRVNSANVLFRPVVPR